jgi:hypothetical protein
MDTDHDIVIATPIGQLYGTQETITKAFTHTRCDILYDTIKNIQDTCQPLKTAKLKNNEA